VADLKRWAKKTMKLPIVWLMLVFAASAVAADFKADDVSGQRWALVDQKKIEIYRLGENGVVLAELGSKDGELAGPAFHWKVDQGIVIIESQQSVYQRFTLVERKGDQVTVRRQSGELAIFQVTTLKK
jgi:hypothetical protein